jgi:hypothetical protein
MRSGRENGDAHPVERDLRSILEGNYESPAVGKKDL